MLFLGLLQITDVDKDHRYMATSDLARELQSPQLVLDDYESKRVTSAVLKQLNDASGDISGLANTCLGMLVGKVDIKFVKEMCMALLTQMKEDKDDMKRDVAYIGLKTIIQHIPAQDVRGTHASSVGEYLGPLIMDCIQSGKEEISGNGYDLLLLFLVQHGPCFPGITSMANVCVKEFENPRPGIRKKAMQCLGKMAASLPHGDFDRLCAAILGKLKPYAGNDSLSKAELERVQTLIMSMTFIGRGAGYKLEKYVPELVVLCVGFATCALEDEDGVDLAESCLVVLELCILKCPKASDEKRMDIMNLALRCIKYDPNYAADSEMEEEDDGDMSASEEMDGSEYDDDEDAYSDDDDSSWKVRRASCKLLSIIVKVYCSGGHVSDMFEMGHDVLIKRAVVEREDAVRQEIFSTYLDFLNIVDQCIDSSKKQKLETELEDVAVKFVRLLKRQSAKVKSCIYRVLTNITQIRPSVFFIVLPKGANDIVLCLKDDSVSKLQVQVLEFLEVALDNNRPDTEMDELVRVAEEILECSKKKYFALAVVALKVCQKLVFWIRPDVSSHVIPSMSCIVLPFFITITDVLSSSEKPQEVKNATIECIGDALARMGDLLEGTQVEALAKDFAAMPSNTKRAKIQGSNDSNTGHLPRLKDVLSIVIERLENETTRLAALRAIKKVSESPLSLELHNAFGDAVASIKSYFRKLDRNIRITSIDTLSSIISSRNGIVELPDVQSIVNEVSPLISDADLGVSNSVMALLENVVRVKSDLTSVVLENLFQNIEVVLSSPTLQSSSLEKMQELLSACVKQMPQHENETIDNLLVLGRNATSKHMSIAVAKCTVSIAQCSENAADFFNSKIAHPQTAATIEEKNFLLYCIRDAGAHKIISQGNDELREAVIMCMNDESSEAAALALGGLACSDDASHLQYIVQNLSQSGEKKIQYQLLKAMDEALKILSRSSNVVQIEPVMISNIVSILIQRNTFEDSNEEDQAIIAECYGYACLISPDLVLPTFEDQLNSGNPQNRMMALSGLKNSVLDSDHSIDQVLRDKWIPEAMKRLSDGDVSVRRSATLLLTLVAHSKISVVRHILNDCLPAVLHQTKPDPDLIRIVNLGPFKHKIDDGLEQRKAAFDCLGILISKSWESLVDHSAILDSIVTGLSDQYEVKLKCHDLIASFAQLDSSLVLSILDKVVEPFTKTLTARIKSDAVRQEIDRNEDMLRSCLRAVDALERLDGSKDAVGFKTFLETVVKSDQLKAKYMSIIKERKQADGI